MNYNIDDKVLIVGPSHVVRWEYFNANGLLPDVRDKVDFFGVAGCPIWHEKIVSNVDLFKTYRKVLFIVGDFRFGNSVVLGDHVEDAYGVAKELINIENDKKLFLKSMDALHYLQNSLGDKVQFVFWDLVLRENRNRLSNKYLETGRYLHPVWNYEAVHEAFKGCSADFRPVISSRDLSCLYVDNSNHPSVIGFSFLLDCALKATRDLIVLDENMLNKMQRLADSFSYNRLGSKILVVGDSGADRYSASSLLKFLINFYKKGMFGSSGIFFSREFDLHYVKEREIGHVVFISSLNSKDSAEAKEIKCQRIVELDGKARSAGLNVGWLLWEELSQQLIDNGLISFQALLDEMPALSGVIERSVTLRLNSALDLSVLFEKNKAFHPTFFFLVALLSFLESVDLRYNRSLHLYLDGSQYMKGLNNYFHSMKYAFYFKDDNFVHRESLDINNRAKRFICEGEWLRAVEVLSSNTDEFGDNRVLRKIVYDKNFRPVCIREQAELLRYIFEDLNFSLSHRLNALTAHSHKVMEGMLPDLVDSAIKDLLISHKMVDRLGFSDNIRMDRNHIYFSMLTVLWHLYIYKGDIDKFLMVGELAFDQFENLDDETLTNGFYQTCTNLVRCHAVAYLNASIKGDRVLCDRVFKSLERVLYLGVVHSDSHEVKFKEYIGVTSVYFTIKRYRNVFLENAKGTDLYHKACEDLVLFSIRSHGQEKVQRIKDNIRFLSGIN